MTGNDIILEALLLDGVIYPGQTISAEASATSQLGLNNLLSEWSAQGLAIFCVKKSTTALSSGVGEYTFSGSARPEKVEAWRVIDSSGGSNGGSPVNSKDFSRIADDDALIAARVDALYYDGDFPTGTVKIYPKPAGGTLELWIWEQFSQISDFTITVTFPPGYQKAVVYNLAKDLAPKFGRPLDPTVEKIANEMKATLAGTNASEMSRAPGQKAA